MYKNLHSYIAELERAGELIRIKEFVDPVLEMAEIADRMAKSEGGGKALLFEHNATEFPVLLNMFGSQERTLRALGIGSYDEVEQRIDQLFNNILSPKPTLWDKLKILPTLKQAAQWLPKTAHTRGACQEVVNRQPDLTRLPILKCWPYDGGRFITLPMVHTKDPVSGMRNVGMYRMQVFSYNTTGMHWHRHKTGARHFAKFMEENPEGGHFPVAVALGGDPVYTYCATAPLPENVDEYLLAGFLRNRPVSLVRCITQPLEVPADADIIIEGYIDSHKFLAKEGPFGDHTGFYSLEDLYPVMHVTCVTHRKDAVYPATIVGIPPQEDAYLAQATERIFLAPIRMALAPEILDLHLPNEGVSHNLAIVKIKKDYPGQALKIAHTLWGAGQMMFNKILVMVDGNVPITNYKAVLKHVAQHYNPSTDTYFARGPLDVLDHAAEAPAFGGKMCIDATTKMTEELSISNKHLKVETQPHGIDTGYYSFVHKSDPIPPSSRIVAIFDEPVDTEDVPTCVWLLGNNIDAMRDCRIAGNQLLIDATSKPEQVAPRRWPNIVCSSDATISAINAKWPKLGLGRLIESPSLRYRPLVQPGRAAVEPISDIKKQQPDELIIETTMAGTTPQAIPEEKAEAENPIELTTHGETTATVEETIVDIEKPLPDSDAMSQEEDTEPEEEEQPVPETHTELEPNLETTFYQSPIGCLKIEATAAGIRSILFCDGEAQAASSATKNALLQQCIQELDEYFAGKRLQFDLPLDMEGTDFQLRVWRELCTIPCGETISYIELARRLGDTKATRAVGAANGQNKLFIVVPCHRAVGANGKLVGYAGGLPRKEWLLKHELQHAGQGLFKKL